MASNNLKNGIVVLTCILTVYVSGIHLDKKPSYDLDTSRDLFEEFTKIFNKTYTDYEEYEKRHQIFRDNLKHINKLNEDIERAVYSINHFTDLTREEFKKMYTGFELPKELRTSSGVKFNLNNLPKRVPKSFDFRDLGVVTPVKGQLNCGSCWAFSAIANIESQYAIHVGPLQTFSEQQLLDCDTQAHGCDGGSMGQAFEFLKDEGGVISDADYPYKAKKDQCAFVQEKIKVKIAGMKESESMDEEDLKKLLFATGPLSIGVNADTMKHYRGGIDHPNIEQCNPKNIDHGVTLVGYGEENGMKYWIIKNSWTSAWGEKGYYRLQRGTGACGVNTYIATAVLA